METSTDRRQILEEDLSERTGELFVEAEEKGLSLNALREAHQTMLMWFIRQNGLRVPGWRLTRYCGIIYNSKESDTPLTPQQINAYEEKTHYAGMDQTLFGDEFPGKPVLIGQVG